MEKYESNPRRAPHPLHGVLLSLTMLMFNTTWARAGDWPQFRGPSRNGVSNETGWFGKSAKTAWKINVGKGYSAAAVSGGRLYTMGNNGSSDTVYCLNASTGKTIWKRSYHCPGGDYPGPRATPTVSGGRVYTLSREGHAYCLNASTGKPVWTRDLKKALKAQPPGWGFAGSVLLEGSLVILNVGTSGVALNKSNGQTAWQTGGGKSGYATPVAFSIGRTRAIAMFTTPGLVTVNASTGKKLWSYAWKTQYDVNAADPIVSGGKIFISSGYNIGGALLQASATSAKLVWKSKDMRNHFSSCVLYGGYLYGTDEGTLKCVSFTNGQRKWAKGGFGKGGLMIADGKLIVLSERGELVIAKAQPAGYSELKRTSVLSATCWTPPVLANGRVYCRNKKGDLACVSLK